MSEVQKSWVHGSYRLPCPVRHLQADAKRKKENRSAGPCVESLVNPSKTVGPRRGSLGIPDWRTLHTEPYLRAGSLFNEYWFNQRWSRTCFADRFLELDATDTRSDWQAPPLQQFVAIEPESASARCPEPPPRQMHPPAPATAPPRPAPSAACRGLPPLQTATIPPASPQTPLRPPSPT